MLNQHDFQAEVQAHLRQYDERVTELQNILDCYDQQFTRMQTTVEEMKQEFEFNLSQISREFVPANLLTILLLHYF